MLVHQHEDRAPRLQVREHLAHALTALVQHRLAAHADAPLADLIEGAVVEGAVDDRHRHAVVGGGEPDHLPVPQMRRGDHHAAPRRHRGLQVLDPLGGAAVGAVAQGVEPDVFGQHPPEIVADVACQRADLIGRGAGAHPREVARHAAARGQARQRIAADGAEGADHPVRRQQQPRQHESDEQRGGQRFDRRLEPGAKGKGCGAHGAALLPGCGPPVKRRGPSGRGIAGPAAAATAPSRRRSPTAARRRRGPPRRPAPSRAGSSPASRR